MSKGLPKDKGSGSSSLSSSFSIRFNATDDSLDDFITSSAPAAPLLTQNSNSTVAATAEESIWKRDFLQGSFFSRKRSNSNENNSIIITPTNVVPAAADQSSSGGSVSPPTVDTTTWARFKGKVNQAMEDIKSSKEKGGGNAPLNVIDSLNGSEMASVIDSTTTAQSSISEDYLDPQSVAADADNSDNDVDSEIFNGQDEPASRSARIKRSIRSIRNRDSLKANLIKAKETTKDVFGRNKKQGGDNLTITTDAASKKVDIEIESGVEMLEDMEPAVGTASGDGDKGPFDSSEANGEMKLRTPAALNFGQVMKPSGTASTSEAAATTPNSLLANILPTLSASICNRTSVICLGLLAVLIVAPVPPFLQGVIACLVSIVTISTLYNAICSLIVAVVSQNNPNGPETIPFAIPDYTKMPVCEIPVVEEHKSLKSYSGWMNEINSYDPDNFHIGMTKSVYVKLDGTRLKVSNVANRVAKRSMWNETLVDKKHLIVTRNRTFDLLNCRVEMCPKGLARKRYFNRKYPIQLIIPNGLVSPEDVIRVPSASTLTPQLQDSPTDGEEKLIFLNDFDSTDFGTAILNADTASLQQLSVPEATTTTTGGVGPREATPCGDEVRLLLFARCDREKEDWYRRFQSASIGAVRDNENAVANLKYVTDMEAQAMRQVIQNLENLVEEEKQRMSGTKKDGDEAKDDAEPVFPPDSQFDGLLMTPCSARSHPDYVKFMSKYQSACKRKHHRKEPVAQSERKSRREKKEDELWKGIDQTLFLGPSSDVIWANVLLGRVIYSCLNDDPMLERVQEFLQKKLSAIKLPNFMEDVTIAQLCLGDKPPLVHRVSQPLLDERGTWLDADLTYEGLIQATVTTKLNLLRLRRQHAAAAAGGSSAAPFAQPSSDSLKTQKSPVAPPRLQMSSIYDSDAESTGGSSSESESIGGSSTVASSSMIVDSAATVAASGAAGGQAAGADLVVGSAANAAQGGSSSSRKLLRIVDKITASNLFQSATEISYVQRAMENMSTKIKLQVQLKGLVSRVVLNIPPPPSDRIWVGFRGPPRLWIAAKPALGDHSMDWSIVTNVIENKLCEEVYKYLVYPNMVDVIVPLLGQSTYKEE